MNQVKENFMIWNRALTGDEEKGLALWTIVMVELTKTDLGSERKRRSKDDADISCSSEGKDGRSVSEDWELGAKSGLKVPVAVSSPSKQSCQLQL